MSDDITKDILHQLETEEMTFGAGFKAGRQATLREVREMVEGFGTTWPEPNKDAGVGGPGPLFTSGLYAQYDIDKKNHEGYVQAILQALDTLSTKL